MSSSRRCLVALLCALVLLPTGVGAHATTPQERQWGLHQIGAPQAWGTSRGEGVVVAVVDTGVALSHPDLAPRLHRDGEGRVVGRDEVDGDDHPQDHHGHGTLVAGVAAAAADEGLDGAGIAGVAPRARIMPVRVLDEEGRGSMSDLDAGIRWAVDNGADVVNLSLESAVPVPGELLATGPDDAVAYAWERGVPVVAAAGNSGTPFTDYRSDTPVLLVGATDREDGRAAFSDAGRSDMVLAPGVDILSSACDPCGRQAEHGYAAASGTSLAAPHAAGAAALLLAAGLDHEQAVQRLRDTAVEVSGGMVGASSGHGRIDAAAAVETTAGAQDEPDPATGDPSDDADADRTTGADTASDDEARGTPEPTDEPQARGAADDEGAAEPDAEGRATDEDAPAHDAGSSTGDADHAPGAGDEPAEAAPPDDDAGAEGGRDTHAEAGAVDVPPGAQDTADGPGIVAGVAVGMVAASLLAVAGASRRFGLR